jgi:hypothetical protein
MLSGGRKKQSERKIKKKCQSAAASANTSFREKGTFETVDKFLTTSHNLTINTQRTMNQSQINSNESMIQRRRGQEIDRSFLTTAKTRANDNEGMATLVEENALANNEEVGYFGYLRDTNEGKETPGPEIDERGAPFNDRKSESPSRTENSEKSAYKRMRAKNQGRFSSFQQLRASTNDDMIPGIENKDEQKGAEGEATCLICFEQPPDAVFMDCGHGGICYQCSIDIWKTTGECHLCRDVCFFFQ